MGRYYYSKKEEADSLKKIQTWFLKKHGYFSSGYRSGTITWTSNWSDNKSSIGLSSSIYDGEKYIRLNYTQTDRSTEEKKDFKYRITLTSTPCYFGGFRYWFICPWYSNGAYCGRRVGVLYLGGKYFACRHCYDLSYSSRNLGGIWKAAGQVISIPDLEEQQKKIKRKYYAGKMTKRYKSYLKKDRKAMLQMQIVARGLGTEF